MERIELPQMSPEAQWEYHQKIERIISRRRRNTFFKVCGITLAILAGLALMATLWTIGIHFIVKYW